MAVRAVDVLGRPVWNLWVDGESVPAASGAVYSPVNPATGEPLASVSDAGPADVALAVASAIRAQRDWEARSARDRGRVLRSLAGILRANAEEMALLDALDSGNPLSAMRNDVEWAAELLELFSEGSHSLDGQAIRASQPNLHFTERVPFGVVARIVPFNHPLFFAAGKIAAPLMAGNAVIVKPSELTPLAALRFAELTADVLPRGLVSVLTCSDSTAGEALVSHPDVSRIPMCPESVSSGARQSGAESKPAPRQPGSKT